METLEALLRQIVPVVMVWGSARVPRFSGGHPSVLSQIPTPLDRCLDTCSYRSSSRGVFLGGGHGYLQPLGYTGRACASFAAWPQVTSVPDPSLEGPKGWGHDVLGVWYPALSAPNIRCDTASCPCSFLPFKVSRKVPANHHTAKTLVRGTLNVCVQDSWILSHEE